jgi:hypothetical protein
VVVFDLRQDDANEFFSGLIDPRLGPGPLQVVLGLEQGRGEAIFSGAFESFEQLNYPQVFLGAEIEPRRGRFRVGIRVLNREIPFTQVRVRWWACLPAEDLGEVVVTPTPRPTVGPTISPTIGPTIVPTIRPTPTIGPTIGPIFDPGIAATLSPGGISVTPDRPVRQPRGGRARPLTEVRGVGEAFARRLRAAGIRDAAALAAADVARVAEVLGVSPVRARDIVESARSLE